MVVRQDTLWERFLKPVFGLLIDETSLLELRNRIDWEQGCDRLAQAELTYPEYYHSQNFHGVPNGYLSVDAAVSYDPITQYLLLPNETWIRQKLVNTIGGQPRRILDLGCGTGSTTLLLKQAFPQAQVMGLDLSPQMLVMAEYKAQKAGGGITWHHGNAERAPFPDGYFGVITLSLLFHETPPSIAKAILCEAFRLLSPGGQIAILDGNQQVLRQTDWLTELFEEPYIKDYAQGNVAAWLGTCGFEAVQSDDFWWVHQVTTAMKPTPIPSPTHAKLTPVLATSGGAIPAFS